MNRHSASCWRSSRTRSAKTTHVLPRDSHCCAGWPRCSTVTTECGGTPARRRARRDWPGWLCAAADTGRAPVMRRTTNGASAGRPRSSGPSERRQDRWPCRTPGNDRAGRRDWRSRWRSGSPACGCIWMRRSGARPSASSERMGWRVGPNRLSGIHEHAAGLMTALARIVECGGVDGVEKQHLGAPRPEPRDHRHRGPRCRRRRRPSGATDSGRAGSELRHGRLDDSSRWEGISSTARPAGWSSACSTSALPQAPASTTTPTSRRPGFVGVSQACSISLRRELLELGPSHLPVLLVG